MELTLDRLTEQQKVIDLHSEEHGRTETLTSTVRELVEHVVEILQPFNAATLELSADDAYISIKIPLVATRQGKLQTTTADRGLLQTKVAVRDCESPVFLRLQLQQLGMLKPDFSTTCSRFAITRCQPKSVMITRVKGRQ